MSFGGSVIIRLLIEAHFDEQSSLTSCSNETLTFHLVVKFGISNSLQANIFMSNRVALGFAIWKCHSWLKVGTKTTSKVVLLSKKNLQANAGKPSKF